MCLHHVLKVFVLAESFGGYGSLADHPALMTHKYSSAEERERIGVSDTLVGGADNAEYL